MNDALHNHLRLHSGLTLDQMFDDLERLRRHGIPHDDLPATKQEFADGLRLLVVAGLAEKSGDLWLWLPAKVKEAERVEKRHKQAELFV
jgi:hypothetical protein